jgi:hypothetical protein
MGTPFAVRQWGKTAAPGKFRRSAKTFCDIAMAARFPFQGAGTLHTEISDLHGLLRRLLIFCAPLTVFRNSVCRGFAPPL